VLLAAFAKGQGNRPHYGNQQRDRRRRRPRYHESDEGREDDPYAEYLEYEGEF